MLLICQVLCLELLKTMIHLILTAIREVGILLPLFYYAWHILE